MEITLSRNAGRLVASTQTTEYFFDKTRTAQEAMDHVRTVYPGCDLVLSGEVADEIEPAPQVEPSFERVEECAHGWNTQYPEHWRARREAQGFTEAEICDAAILGDARHEMYSTLCQVYGDPAYGGGGYSNERIWKEILDTINRAPGIFGGLYPGHPYIKAAEIIRRRKA